MVGSDRAPIDPDFGFAVNAAENKPWDFVFPIGGYRDFFPVPPGAWIRTEEFGGFGFFAERAEAEELFLFGEKFGFIIAEEGFGFKGHALRVPRTGHMDCA